MRQVSQASSDQLQQIGNRGTTGHRFFKLSLILIVTGGASVMLFYFSRLNVRQIDWRFVLLLAAMATVAERLIGLGLAVRSGIIQRHQGTIEIESKVGQGTSFHIRLPVAKTKPVTEVSKTATARSTLVPNTSLPKILVVDDEESIRELLMDILESEGYQVVLAENGEEGLKLFDAVTFTAVFTDVGMPGMSGWEFARAIRARNEVVPMAVITGWGESVSSTEQQTAKVDWVVTKPFSIDRICELAAEVTQRSELTYSSTLVTTGT
jgi:CheY-like chemotaxis protein